MPDVAPDDEPHLAVVKTDRGELTESTLAAEREEARRRHASGGTAGDDADSFPASDPPAGWAGESEADAGRSPVHEVVDVRRLGDDEELQAPDQR